MKLYDYNVKDAEGNMIPMSNYKGKVLMIVNTATGCGLTPQYEGLQDLYEKYKDRGFEILDFPCNQFANQAPGSVNEIHDFCQTRFGVTFKMFSKIDVNGKNEEPLYNFLKKEKGGLLGSGIKWNFTKFIVDREGQVVKRYTPTAKPEKMEEYLANILE